MSLVNARIGERQPPDWCRTILLVTLPDREQAQAWARRLRHSGAITTLPAHIPYRLAALVEAAEARYVDVNFPDDPGLVDARIIVLTQDLIIDVRSRQIDVRARAASGQATTTVTLRPLSDVRQLAISGDDVDWSPELLRGRLSNLPDGMIRLLAYLEEHPQYSNSDTDRPGIARKRPRLTQPNRKLQPTEIDKLVQLYADGLSVNELARRFKLHRETARNHLLRRGVELRSSTPALAPEQQAEVIRKYESGLSTYKLGVEFGVSSDTIRQLLLRAGVVMRTRTDWRHAPPQHVAPRSG